MTKIVAIICCNKFVAKNTTHAETHNCRGAYLVLTRKPWSATAKEYMTSLNGFDRRIIGHVGWFHFAMLSKNEKRPSKAFSDIHSSQLVVHQFMDALAVFSSMHSITV